jgi:oligopeptide transport system substrate-binding protein
MKTQKLMRSLLVMLLAVAMLLTTVSCTFISNIFGGEEETTTNGGNGTVVTPEVLKGHKDTKMYTYNTFTSVSPSNWNELTYQDNNDTQIMSYISSSFFSFDFKYDEDGEIIPGDFVIKYDAATDLEDVSALVDAKWGVPADGKGYAYKITLREDLKWDDGTPITAADFVWTMKQQLDPLFQNYRADSFYVGSTILVNAQNYVKQGQLAWEPGDGIYPEYSEDIDSKLVFTLAPPVKADPEKGIEAKPEVALRTMMGFPASYTAANCAAYLIGNYLGECAFTLETAAAMEGKTFAEIKADATLKAAWDALIGWWQTEPNEELHFFITQYEFPAVDFAEVGIYAEDTYELVIVLAKPLDLLKEDGSLSYKAAYNMSSLPLVHQAKFDANKVPPTEGNDLWTSKYNSDVATTASWGPYKLESFQAGKQYVLVRNDNWYGYNMEENDDLYQTDRIVCDTIEEYNSAWIAFLAGNLDGIGIDVSIADDYKGSDRAYFTPDDYIQSLQLQSDKAQLAARESEGVNKTIMSYIDFRNAISLGINRADFAAQTTTSSLQGFGIFNSMHYYDVANGKAYRESDDAKKVLCEVYNVDYTKYESLDAAVDAITGYDLTKAKELFTKAYNDALAAGDLKEGDKVVLTMGSSVINEVVQRRFDYIANALKAAVVGTPLEGKLEFDQKEFGDTWANDFRAGMYDICMGGWTGAAWDPGYFLLAYLSADYMYSAAWETGVQTMTFVMKGVGEDGGDIEETMTLLEWYDCLNGASGAKYDWSSNALEESQRLQLIAALEREVLKAYYTVPLYYNFAASLLSYKVDYITYEYNTFMGYGGMKYMTFNFDDEGWAAEVAKYDGELNYK